MAEALLRRAMGDAAIVASAGSKPSGYVHPLAIAAMNEIGLDLSTHYSKHLEIFLDQPVDIVITVCGHADASCPHFPGQRIRYHWPFPDPAEATGTDEEKLTVFRSVRDRIQQVFEAFAAGYQSGALNQ